MKTFDLFALAAPALIALLLIALVPHPALASETSVDLGGLLPSLIETLALVVSGVAVWAVRRFLAEMEQRTNIQIDDQLKARIDDAMRRAIDYGTAKAMHAAKSGVQVDVRSKALAEATNYVIEAVPTALEYFGIDRAGVTRRLEARLGLDLDGDGRVGFTAADR
ncbi:inadl protein [Pannonibacter tanglangensis]|uniref:Inadl protein n=1 Tax=Pannonibacter tanglangensis TaxID=2750084 RepID=A0ABW9ZEB9_9HYPH|nr:inadl protein [Pannonibacter sp. XCT-34]NBN62769.1 inadl protein [Pannonibacter sp. XCT-34]